MSEAEFSMKPPDQSDKDAVVKYNAYITLIANKNTPSQAKMYVDEYVRSGLELDKLLRAVFKEDELNWARKSLGYAEAP
ncbi:MAG: hypothetical protein HZA34_00515 [Candidatus Pacebacteria bacterium]|nr:hypothetical protein [Candidatus Paceibacterota bacterium]